MIPGQQACFVPLFVWVWLLPIVVAAEPHTAHTGSEVPISYPHQLLQSFVSLDAEFFIFGSLMHVMRDANYQLSWIWCAKGSSAEYISSFLLDFSLSLYKYVVLL